MSRLFVVCILPFCAPLAMASAPSVLPPASERFEKASSEEIPHFQRHILPLLGQLGCNGRACHGSFQGQGGFRLSLFGYDFKEDHTALTGGEKPRVDSKKPMQSLILLKPTGKVPHKGGRLLDPESWQYNLLHRWIQAGASTVSEKDAAFASLEIKPREIVFARTGETVQLKVTARWSDGVIEDVTPLCRFRSNNEAIATIDADGLVKSVGKGGTDVVAFYDNGVATVTVILPVSDRVGAMYPKAPTPTRVDELVVARLQKLGIVPSELCTDEEFLRRVSLDLTGTLPSPDDVLAFMANKRADKRERKIDELLERPAYAAWWATKLGDMTGNSEAVGPLGGERGLNRERSKHWYQWLHRRVQDNMPYDKIVEGIVLATSRKPGQSYEDYCAEMSSYFRLKDPGDFAARDTMPHFWIRRPLGRPEGKALAFAYSFLGVSLQCAECHKHPYDQWTKDDFDQFAAFFNGIGFRDGGREVSKKMKAKVGLTGDPDSGAYSRQFVKLAEGGTELPFFELVVPAKAKGGKAARPIKTKAGRVITPKLLGGEEVLANQYDDPRRPLMDWLRDEDNPYFARAFVNRVWGNYFNVGLIHPGDDLNLANPPSNPALMEYLTRGFIDSGYDMKWLHRQIARSRTYQLSWRPNETNKNDERNYSRSVLRRLPAEVLVDAIAQATASDDGLKAYQKDPVTTRSIGHSSGFSNRAGSNFALNLFGKPARLLNCDCERSAEPSLLQTVYLRNDKDIQAMLNHPNGWLKQIAKTKMHDRNDLIRQAYLRTLSRLPDERERTIAHKHLETASDTLSGMRDLMWALINTKEFIVNR